MIKGVNPGCATRRLGRGCVGHCLIVVLERFERYHQRIRCLPGYHEPGRVAQIDPRVLVHFGELRRRCRCRYGVIRGGPCSGKQVRRFLSRVFGIQR